MGCFSCIHWILCTFVLYLDSVMINLTLIILFLDILSFLFEKKKISRIIKIESAHNNDSGAKRYDPSASINDVNDQLASCCS